MKNILFLTLIIAPLFIGTSCGPQTEEEVTSSPGVEQVAPTDALVYYGSNEWPVACYFYDPLSKDFGQNLPIWNQAWVWATTADNKKVYVQGKKEGGFVVVDGVYYSKTGPGGVLMPQVKNTNDLENVCRDSIKRYHPKKNYKLIDMVASLNEQVISNLTVNAFPIVIGEKSNPNKITRMVVFGDSLSDTGRLKKWLQIMPERPFFLGRFTNGGTWNDYLGEKEDIAVLNYSMGGAVTKPNITNTVEQVKKYVTAIGRYFVTRSIRNFVKDYTNNELKGKPVPDSDRTLFVIWGGANDFLSRFDKKSDIDTFINNPNAYGAGYESVTEQTVFNIAQEVKGLIALGAKNIMVINLPDVGKTPRMLENSGYKNNTEADKYEFSTKLSEIISNYNKKLASKIAELQTTEKGAKIILFDSASALDDLMQGRGPNGEPNFNYGINLNTSFTKLRSPNKPDIKVGVKCYQGSYLGSTDDKLLCKDGATRLFFDEVHPGWAGQKAMAFKMAAFLYKNGLLKVLPTWALFSSP